MGTVYYFHNQLTIKSMNITYYKTTHLVGLTKPKQAYQQSPAGSDHPIHKSQQLKNTWTGQPNFNNKWIAGAPSHQVLTCLISQKTDMCPPGDESFLHKLKSHHLSSDIKLKVMWQSWESFSQLLLLSPSAHSVKKTKLPWPDQWSSWNDTKSAHFHTKNMYFLVHEPSTWTPNGKT